MTSIIKMEKITKRFPGVLANDHVDLEVEKGEIHVLLGENGAGKTTLMNILYGLHQPDAGTIYLKGREVKINSPRKAIDLGIGMVHQHFMLIPALTVTENIVLGTKVPREPFLDLTGSAEKIKALSRQYGFNLDPSVKVWHLSVGQQQRVEIIKTLYRGADILILDEPTAVLTPQETQELFAILRRLKDEGHTVIFISHKLNEVMEISDRITVLRQGRVIKTLRTKDTNKAELARLMVGREVSFVVEKTPCQPGQEALRISGLKARNDRQLEAVKSIDLAVRAGEILGLAGVDGNGQSELVEAIAGLRKATGGEVFFLGQPVRHQPLRRLFEMGLGFIPEDRHRQGLVKEMPLMENLILQRFYRPPFARYGFLNYRVIREYANELIKKYDIRTPSPLVPAKNLSGGNQQKVVLAREMDRQPALLIAMHPTRGLDVGATEYVHRRIIEERDRGCAILLVSTELEEILALSDRIAVIYEGEIMGVLNRNEISIEDLGLMMAGSKRLSREVSHG